MRLYTRSDLERCARLAVSKSGPYAFEHRPGLESAVTEAVDIITAEGPDYFTRHQVEVTARIAAELAVEGLAVGDAAHTALQRL